MFTSIQSDKQITTVLHAGITCTSNKCCYKW